MTDQQHPITPPAEVVQKLADGPGTWLEKISKAYCAGADQELEASVAWLKGEAMTKMWNTVAELASELHASRRPKPPSLKEQALQTLENADGADYPVVATVLTADQHALIRRALESLPD